MHVKFHKYSKACKNRTSLLQNPVLKGNISRSCQKVYDITVMKEFLQKVEFHLLDAVLDIFWINVKKYEGKESEKFYPQTLLSTQTLGVCFWIDLHKSYRIKG